MKDVDCGTFAEGRRILFLPEIPIIGYGSGGGADIVPVKRLTVVLLIAGKRCAAADGINRHDPHAQLINAIVDGVAVNYLPIGFKGGNDGGFQGGINALKGNGVELIVRACCPSGGSDHAQLVGAGAIRHLAGRLPLAGGGEVVAGNILYLQIIGIPNEVVVDLGDGGLVPGGKPYIHGDGLSHAEQKLGRVIGYAVVVDIEGKGELLCKFEVTIAIIIVADMRVISAIEGK
jgi:hypothetical protein